MNGEIMKTQNELWYNGANYTADAVIVDTTRQSILLIQRHDCGQWALPGGFVDNDEQHIDTAKREAMEETNLEIFDGRLLYQGIVDDPRNSEHAWIETSAYLFYVLQQNRVTAGDDADDVRWFSLNDLPLPMYASHESIIMLAIEALKTTD